MLVASEPALVRRCSSNPHEPLTNGFTNEVTNGLAAQVGSPVVLMLPVPMLQLVLRKLFAHKQPELYRHAATLACRRATP